MIQYCDEATAKELASRSIRKTGVGGISYLEFNNKGEAVFQIKDQTCRLLFDDVNNLSIKDRMNYRVLQSLMKGNVHVDCTCEDFSYGGFRYIGTIQDYSIDKEYRYPVVRNANLKGTVCKHLTSLLKTLPSFQSVLIFDMMKLRNESLQERLFTTLDLYLVKYKSDFILRDSDNGWSYNLTSKKNGTRILIDRYDDKMKYNISINDPISKINHAEFCTLKQIPDVLDKLIRKYKIESYNTTIWTESDLPGSIKLFLKDFIKWNPGTITQKDVDNHKFTAKDVNVLARLYAKYYQTKANHGGDAYVKDRGNPTTSFVHDEYEEADVKIVVDMFKSRKMKLSFEDDLTSIKQGIQSILQRVLPSVLITDIRLTAGNDTLGNSYLYFAMEYKSDHFGTASFIYNDDRSKWDLNYWDFDNETSPLNKTVKSSNRSILQFLNTKYK